MEHYFRRSTVIVVAMVSLAVVGMIAAPVAVAADEGNETATPTPTPEQTGTTESDECEVGPNDPNLRQSGLHTTDNVINVGDPAEIAGQFRLSSASNCAVMVSVTLNAPNGIYFEGGQNIEGGTSGLAHGEFLVDDGDPKEVRATVYSQIEGDQLITADVEYWPVGHSDEVATQTYRMSIDVEESNEDEFERGEISDDWSLPIEIFHIGLIGIALIGLVGIAYKNTNADIIFKKD